MARGWKYLILRVVSSALSNPVILSIPTPALAMPVSREKSLGYNAFSNIQSSVNAVSVAGTVRVLGGIYSERVIIDKSSTMLGAQAGFDARSRGGSESLVRPDISSPDPNDVNFISLFYVAADNVTIDGFTFHSDLPTSGQLPDIKLVGTNVGEVKGSITWNADTNTISFVKTGGVLEADTYDVTLESGSAAIKDALTGSLLDGNGNFTPGDDYFSDDHVIAAPVSGTRVVSIRDFAHGSAQDVDDIPATANSCLGVRVDDATGVTSLDFNLKYDSALLTINNVLLSQAAIDEGWAITINHNTLTGVLEVSAFGSALSGSDLAVILLDASIPEGAAYGELQVLKLSNIVLGSGGGPLSVLADRAIHKSTYLADADCSSNYADPNDPALTTRVAVELDAASANTVGLTQNGRLSVRAILCLL
jgi:hypothetical protein